MAGQPLRVGTAEFENGVGTHASAELVYRLDGKYRWLTFYAGVSADMTEQGSVKRAYPTLKEAAEFFLGGSIVPGIPMSLTQTGSTRRRHGKHPKSIWTTAASWFSNTPEDPDRIVKKPQSKEILAMRSGEPRSPRMKSP